MQTIGKPGVVPIGADEPVVVDQSAPSTPRSQRGQLHASFAWRGCSRSTGGSSARGRTSPSNGHVSHSSTGGARSAPRVRAQNTSGVSGTSRGLLVLALPALVSVEVLRRGDVAERGVVRRDLLGRLHAELLREHRAQRLDLHLAEARAGCRSACAGPSRRSRRARSAPRLRRTPPTRRPRGRAHAAPSRPGSGGSRASSRTRRRDPSPPACAGRASGPLLEHVRPGERLLHRHLLVDREADEQRERVLSEELAGLRVVGEPQRVRREAYYLLAPSAASSVWRSRSAARSVLEPSRRSLSSFSGRSRADARAARVALDLDCPPLRGFQHRRRPRCCADSRMLVAPTAAPSRSIASISASRSSVVQRHRVLRRPVASLGLARVLARDFELGDPRLRPFRFFAQPPARAWR